ATYGQRHGPVDRQLLWHVTDAQVTGTGNRALAWPQHTGDELCGRRLAGPVRADQGQDFAAIDGKIDAPHQPTTVALDSRILQADKLVAVLPSALVLHQHLFLVPGCLPL